MTEFFESIFPFGAFFLIGFFAAAGWVTFQFILKVIKNYFIWVNDFETADVRISPKSNTS